MSYFAKLTVHVGLVFLAFIPAYALRRGLLPEWWFANHQALAVITWAGVYAVMGGLYELLFRTERGAWRFSSARDVVRLAQSTGLTAITFLALIFITNRAITLPRSTLILSWLISLFALVAVRLVWRLRFDRSLASALFPSWTRKTDPGRRPLVLVGNAAAAEAYLRRHFASSGQEYTPVAIIAMTASLTGQRALGVPVLGAIADLEEVTAEISKGGKDGRALLFLDDPIKALGVSAEQIGRLRTEGWLLLRQPSVTEFRQGSGLKEMKLEEFLPREPISLDSAPLEALIKDRRVLVTGAGGSIGSEICRQLVAFGCSHIALLDHSEFLLFEIDRELESADDGATRSAHLCNVRDLGRLESIFTEERPELVFHAAALKHVTLVEKNPAEGVLTNVIGTRNVVSASQAAGVRQMVLISTDKAVAPTNVMGATKRLAEAIVTSSGSAVRSCIVRFGNVLGSAGSVIPIFQDQIERGGPITITHADVERYFMTIPEAVQLVLHSTALSAAGPDDRPRKFTLEMGQPVKIIELARRMIELSGRSPGTDIDIKVTGLRPGEKLSEELIDDNERKAPCIQGINEIDQGAVGDAGIGEMAETLRGLALSGDAAALRKAVFEAIDRVRSGPPAAKARPSSRQKVVQ